MLELLRMDDYVTLCRNGGMVEKLISFDIFVFKYYVYAFQPGVVRSIFQKVNQAKLRRTRAGSIIREVFGAVHSRS